MEGDIDNFLKILQNRARNLKKKQERIKQKQSEVKTSSKSLKEEERKLIESGPIIEELLQETEKLIEQYKVHLESTKKEEKQPAKPDKSKEVINLWVLAEFISDPSLQEQFLKEHPGDQPEIEEFLQIKKTVQGKPQQKLSDVLLSSEKLIESLLLKDLKFSQWGRGLEVPAPQPEAEVKIQSVSNTHEEEKSLVNKAEDKEEYERLGWKEELSEKEDVWEEEPQNEAGQDKQRSSSPDYNVRQQYQDSDRRARGRWRRGRRGYYKDRTNYRGRGRRGYYPQDATRNE